jgi:hypothetical protein
MISNYPHPLSSFLRILFVSGLRTIQRVTEPFYASSPVFLPFVLNTSDHIACSVKWPQSYYFSARHMTPAKEVTTCTFIHGKLQRQFQGVNVLGLLVPDNGSSSDMAQTPQTEKVKTIN